MGFELVEFDEGAAVEQEFDPLACGQAARLALAALPVLAAAELGLARKLAHPFDVFLNAHSPKSRPNPAHASMINLAQASMIWFAGCGAQADLGASSALADSSRGARPASLRPSRAHTIMRQFDRERAGAGVIDETMAERMVACGWIAAAIAGLATLVFSLTSSYGLTHYNLVDAALLFGLAYGIYRRSRICAVLALAYHIRTA